MEVAIRDNTIEIHCADFRQGSEWELHAISALNPHAGSPLKLHLEVTASNMRGMPSWSFELPYVSKYVSVDELISFETREYRIDFPMRPQFEEAMNTQNWNWFDFGEESG